jgi:hypothetical protein
LFGGDREAARELAAETARNNARIVELQQLINRASLDTELRATIEDQVRIIKLEQERLQQLSTREQEDRGLLAGSGKSRSSMLCRTGVFSLLPDNSFFFKKHRIRCK